MSQSLVMGLHLNVMEVATASSTQGGDKNVAPSGNLKRAKTGVGHLIVGMAFSGKGSFVSRILLTRWMRLASRDLQGLPNNSPMELSWAWQPMNVPTMKIFLRKFIHAKMPILVSLACQLGF
ncbi:hypothetical protein Pyn_17810 [Prunus yedoensis var. nudiflora]|uniref:Uncharacterized protein n=1 Tax=Prunus yedoensis var. nudiflora TaxID=2094558 RepID=A0A314V143_PRUYE|nr:hypothetical protein Pyn_17810 [Prunus yedoensis var. nudiflora]